MAGTEKKLAGKVALVTGASRGVGRGIALVLGECGARVYVTARSREDVHTDEPLGGTLAAVAADIERRGGEAVPVRCDHRQDNQVERLFERIGRDEPRLDILVNNIWGGYEHHPGEAFVAPFWDQPLDLWGKMFEAGVRAHMVASRLAARMMIEAGGGLVVNTTAWDRDKYLGNLVYDVAKAAVNRLAYAMGRELKKHGVTALALAPGFTRTERVMAAHREQPFDLMQTESPEYAGRAVAALAADPDVIRLTGRVLTAGELAREYGFVDVDGRQVPPFRLPE